MARDKTKHVKRWGSRVGFDCGNASVQIAEWLPHPADKLTMPVVVRYEHPSGVKVAEGLTMAVTPERDGTTVTGFQADPSAVVAVCEAGLARARKIL